jgi:hypothetical protein
MVPAIGFATSYKWILPSGTQIISGSNSDTITVIFFGSGGDVRVQGVNSCDTGISSVINIKVYSLPKITLISSQKYCCDYGNIDLGSSTFASPSGGTWSCRQNSKLVSSQYFPNLFRLAILPNQVLFHYTIPIRIQLHPALIKIAHISILTLCRRFNLRMAHFVRIKIKLILKPK